MYKKASLKNAWIKGGIFMVSVLVTGVNAKAIEYTYGGIVYEINDDYAFPVNYDGTTADVVLEDRITYNGREYEIRNTFGDMFQNQDNIRSINVSKFDDFLNSFSGCRNLKTVKFAETQTYYVERQFFDCPSLDLKSVLTSNIQYVGEECFGLSEPTDLGTFDDIDIIVCDYNNRALNNRIYSTVKITEIPDEYLTRSRNLEALALSEIKTLYATGFIVDNYYREPFSSLQTLVVTDGSLDVGENFPSIQSITAKGKIEEFRVGSYYSSMENVEINVAGATEISTFAIYNINALTELNLCGKVRDLIISNMPSLSVINGLEGVTRAQIYDCKVLTKIELPDIEEFSSGAFSDNKALTEVYFGDKLREIGTDGVFSGCKSLQDLVYGGTIEQWLDIKKYFDETDYGNALLAKVPNFWYGHGNAKLTKLTELNASHVGSADKINIASFIGFKGLTKIDLPASVKVICASAFEGCSNLSEINIRAERIDQHAFIFCNNIENYTLGDQLTYIGPAFRSNKSKFGTVNFLGTPNQWLKITRTTSGYLDPWDPDSEEGYSKFGSPYISFNDMLFNGSPAENLVIEGVEASGSAFAGIKSLKTVTIKCGDKFPKISSGAFYGCTGLEKVTVEFSTPITKSFDHSNGFVIDEEAFYYCLALKDIEVLDYIKTIAPRALNNTKWLKDQPADEVVYLTTERGMTAYTYPDTPADGSKLIIKDGCKAINNGAFGRSYSSLDPDYKGFNSIDIPTSVEYIGQSALGGLYFKGDFTLPSTVNEIAPNDFMGEIDTFTFAEGTTTLNAAGDYQVTLYVPRVKAVNYNRNFDSHISVQGLDECKKVSYGAGITEVTGGMVVPYSATEVFSFSVTPPSCEYFTSIWDPNTKIYSQFGNVNFDECVLYVPAESVDAYRNAEGWNMFTNIQAVSSGIEDVSVEPADPSLEKHYDINGRIIKRDAKGIHIIVDAHGKVHKRFVR